MTFGPGEIDPSQSRGGGAPARAAPAPTKSPSAAANSTAFSISTAARSPPANGAITPSIFSRTARCSRCSAAPREVPLYRIEKNPKLARRQGAYSVISATGLIVRRGHELDRVLRAIDKLAVAWWRAKRLRRRRCARRRARAASARVSSQRPNLKPTFVERADRRESRSAACSAIDAA